MYQTPIAKYCDANLLNQLHVALHTLDHGTVSSRFVQQSYQSTLDIKNHRLKT